MPKTTLRQRSFLLIIPYILRFCRRLKKMEAGKYFGALVLVMFGTFMYIAHLSVLLNQRSNMRSTRVYSISQEFRNNCTLVQEETVRIKPKNCTYCREYRIYKPIVSMEQTYDVVLMITSSHRKDAAERRRAIRSTWADDNYYSQFKVQHFFVLGRLKIAFLHPSLMRVGALCSANNCFNIIKKSCQLLAKHARFAITIGHSLKAHSYLAKRNGKTKNFFDLCYLFFGLILLFLIFLALFPSFT